MLTVADILFQAVHRTPTQTALICGGREVSYSELFAKAAYVGASLQKRGLVPGDRILTLLQNHEHAAVLHWAAQLYGLVICPLNWRTSNVELDYFVVDCDARAIFYDDSSSAAMDGFQSSNGAIHENVSALVLTDISPLSAIDRNAMPFVDENATSTILYTSGTTGRAKGVPRSHRAERAAAIAHIAQNGLSVGDVALGVMPLYHTMGVRILLTTAMLSGCFVCQERFHAGRSLELIKKHKVSSLYLVPTLYHDLLNCMSVGNHTLASIRKLGTAGASMSDGLLARVNSAFPGIEIVNHYGSSEIYTYTIHPSAASKPGSAGRTGLNSSIAVVPLDARNVTARAQVGQEGQVIASMRSPEAFEGYLNRPDADEKAIVDGWYLTGDVGYVDEAGELFLTGRIDDMINTGGENVSPIEIESVLSLHPGVQEAVVVGKPDERLGQRITAFIRTNRQLDASELDAHCRDAGLPGYRCPKEYQFVDVIPKSPVGKILRRML